jgi:hypothetical protein
MRRALFILLLCSAAGAAGQEVPRAAITGVRVVDESRQAVGGTSTVVPSYGASKTDELLRAQTEAIKALSARIDVLEARVGQLERH